MIELGHSRAPGRLHQHDDGPPWKLGMSNCALACLVRVPFHHLHCGPSRPTSDTRATAPRSRRVVSLTASKRGVGLVVPPRCRDDVAATKALSATRASSRVGRPIPSRLSSKSWNGARAGDVAIAQLGDLDRAKASPAERGARLRSERGRGVRAIVVAEAEIALEQLRRAPAESRLHRRCRTFTLSRERHDPIQRGFVRNFTTRQSTYAAGQEDEADFEVRAGRDVS